MIFLANGSRAGMRAIANAVADEVRQARRCARRGRPDPGQICSIFQRRAKKTLTTRRLSAAVQHISSFGSLAISARIFSTSTIREALGVDIALKLNVLAVCAAFMFVGAILLGAF